MIEVYFNGCSPAHDSVLWSGLPASFNQNVLETIATPSIRFSSCDLRGSVTSLHKVYRSDFGEFIVGVDGSYYKIKGLGISYGSNGVTLSSEQPVPSTGPDSFDCAYNLNCVQLLRWDINRCSFGCFDVVCKGAGCSCDVITNNACYFGAGDGVILNLVGTDTMPFGIKYQGKPIVGNAGTVCVCSNGSQFFYGNNCNSGVLVSTPAGSRDQLYYRGYPLTRCGCVHSVQGIYSFPVYSDFCVACRGTYFNNFDSSVCSIDSDMAWYNGVTDAFYDTCCTCKFPYMYNGVVGTETVYPRLVSLLKTCCCYSGNDPGIHTIMPAPGDVAGLCTNCNGYICIGCDRCNIMVWTTFAGENSVTSYCKPSVVYGMQEDDIRRTDSSAYNSLMGLPIPLTFLTFNIDCHCSLAQFKSCVQNGVLPITLQSGAQFSIRLPIVSKQRREYEDSTSCNVWSGNEVTTEAALVYDPMLERQCLYCFTYWFCRAMCDIYCNMEYTCYYTRIPMCDIWNNLNKYMDQFDLYISEGYATDIDYTPNVMMSSMRYTWTCVPQDSYWHRPIGSNNKAVSSFTQGVGAYDCFYNVMGQFKDYMDACCWSCANYIYSRSQLGSGVSFSSNPIHYNGDCNSAGIVDYQNTKYVYAHYTTARPLIAAAYHNSQYPGTYCDTYYLLDETTLKCFNAQIGGKLNLNKNNRDVTYILGNCGCIISYGDGMFLTEAKCVGYDMIPSSDMDITNCANLFYPSHGQYNNQSGWRECPGFHIITYPRIRVKWTLPWYIGGYNIMNREWH